MKSAQQIAHAWFKKAVDEIDDFDRFVYLWFSFNALYNQFFSYDYSEKYVIKKWFNSSYHSLDKQKIKNIISGDLCNYFKNRIIRDCRGSSKDTSEEVAKLVNIDNSLKYKLCALLMVLYQVRCNLFHGNKMYERDSDQEIIKNAADLLKQILSIVLLDEF